MMFGAIGNADHDDSIRIIHKALDAGINFVDTADVYSRGESEEIVGKALKGRRDAVVLATKVGLPMGDDPNQRGASRRWIMTEVENSLRRLQTDYIDLYQIHRLDLGTHIGETLAALSDLIHAGKVRAIGSSSMPASDIVEAQWVAGRRGLERFRAEHPTYWILSRGIETEVLPVAERYGMGVVVWSLDIVEQAVPLADKAGLRMTHLAMAFAIAHPGVTSALIDEQLDDRPPAGDLELMKRFGELIGQAVEACLEADGQAACLGLR
jgi:aryl-alcohol dehydrogenase-like predicted oxidoreductase